MTDEPYNFREESTFRNELFRRMDNQDTELAEIKDDVKLTKAQAYKTNGRVSKLEWWRSGIVWFFGVIIVLAPIILSVIRSQIRSTVVGVLADYNITVQK